MKVKDVMSTGKLESCTEETKLTNVAKTMKDINLGALPVLDGNKKVVGIVTDRDICLAFAKKTTNNTSDISIKDLRLAKIHTVKENDTVKDALRQMRKNKIGRLPVTDDEGKLKGMLSINNLLSRAINKKEELGQITSKDENLAKTIKALFERNSSNAETVKKEALETETNH
jgi:CBS domain-containing protein